MTLPPLDSRRARDLVARLSGHQVLVVGDVMVDRFIVGDVTRISPEAPVPIVRSTLRDERPGGAANVAMNLAQLGACVTLVGLAGGDDEQKKLESLLSDAGVEPRLTVISNSPTTTKLRILSGHQQIMRLDTESRVAVSDESYAALLEHAMRSIAGGGGCAVRLRERRAW